MAVKILTLVKKNLTLLLRSRSSALILIFGPLLLIVLMSVAFNTAQAYGIVVGTYAKEYTPLTQSLLDALKDKQMSVLTSESQEACVEGVKRGFFTVCMVFPDAFDIHQGGTVTFFVDRTRENIVYLVIESLQSEVVEKSKEIGEQLAQDVLDTLVKSGNELQDKNMLLGEMSSNGRSLETSIDRLHQNFLAFNASASMSLFPFDPLQAEINELKQSSNATTAADEYLHSLKERVEQLVQVVNSFDGVKVNTLKDLSAMKFLIDENLGYAMVLDSGLDQVLMGIRGVKQQSAGKIVSPLDTKIESVVQEKTRLNYVFPTLIALIVMFVGLFLASTLEVRERSEHVAFKNLITPTSSLIFVLGNFLTSMLVILTQLVVLFVVAFFFFREQLIPLLAPLLGVLLLVAGVFVLFGMVLGTLFRSMETSVVAALSVGFLLLFFSSTILPIEALPHALKNIVAYNPFYVAQFVLSKMLLFATPLKMLGSMFIVLGGWFVGLFIILMISVSLRRGE